MILENEIALVSGASRGIGAAIALELGHLGAEVIGTATTEDGVKRIAATFDEKAIKGHAFELDVGDGGSVAALFGKLGEASLSPGILVNNAGITRDNLLVRMKDDDWDSVLQTNLGSVYRMSRACARDMMKRRRGRIINISSVVASSGNQGQCNYAAAKAGMEGFTRSLARELGARGITVNAVAPGFIDTAMTQGLSENHRDALLAGVSLNRLGRPEEVAAAVAFLASPTAGYITGETLHVNGGLYMA